MNTSTFFSTAHPQESPDSLLKTLDFHPRNVPQRVYQAIRRYFSGDAETSDSDSVHPVYAFVRNWAPILVPLLVGSLSLALALLLARRGWGQIDRVTIAGVPLVFLLLLGGGAAFGYMLYLADDEVTWLATLVAGSGIFMATLLSVVAGFLLGMGIIAAHAALLLWYVQAHVYKVAPATLAVTQIFNRHLRTLPPGLHIRLPGERIALTFETWEHCFMSLPETVEKESQDGLLYRACAVATVSYAIDPAQAHRIWQRLNTWERELHESVGPVLLECLTRWTLPLVAGENLAQDAFEQEMLTTLRNQAVVLGVHIKSVRIRNIQLESLNSSAGSWGRHLIYWAAEEMGAPATPVMHNSPTITNRPWPDMPGSEATSTDGRSHPPRSAPSEPAGSSQRANSQSDLQMDPPPEISERPPDGAKDTEVEQLPHMAISPDTLADTYRVIRERQITDPATIRLVAQAFTHVSQDPDLNAQTPYNAAAAARILDDYATRLEQRTAQRSHSLVSAL
jgi:hypothetical protein